MNLTPAEIGRLRSAIEGLLDVLEALTEADGSISPGMADLLRMPQARLERAVQDMRWLLRALQQVEWDYGMSQAEQVE